MTPDQAQALKERIENICQNAGVWCKITHDKRPELRWIRLEIEIKVRKGKLMG
jgi:hypothetical protein